MWTEWQRRRNMAWGAASLLVALLLVAAPAGAALEDSTPITLSNSNSGAFFPYAVVTSGGRVYVAWVDGHDIRFARLGASSGSCGGPGGLAPELFQTLWDGQVNGGIASFVAMAGNGSDGVYVAWQASQGDGSPDIFFRRSTDGGQTFMPPLNEPPVNLTQNVAASTEPGVAADSAGGVFVVWQDNDIVTFKEGFVKIAQSTNGGMNFSTSTVFATGGFGFFQPSVASSGSAVHVVWNAPGLQGIRYARFAAGTDAGGATVSSLTSAFAMYPRIAARGSQVTAAWIEGGNVKARTKTDGQAFGEEEAVYSSGNSVFSLALSLGGSGRFVAWNEFEFDPETGFRSSVRYALGTAPAATLRSGDTFPGAPSVGQDGGSLLVAAWQENGTDSDVSQVKLAHTGGSGGGTPIRANAYVRQPRESILMGARSADNQGRVNVYIELGDGSPGSISARDINPDTLKLNGKDRLPGLTRLGYVDSNRVVDLEVQFPRSAFAGDPYFTVKGETKDGRCFTVTGTVNPKVKVDVRVRR